MGNSIFEKKKILLFDLDGTLTDPGLGITNSVMYALERFGITGVCRQDLYKFIGPPLSQSFERFYGFSKEDALRAVSVYREYFSTKGLFENEIFDGIEVMLKTLKAQGKKVCLATSKPEVFATKILKHFGILTYFDIISGSMLDGTRTDKGEVIAWALSELERRGERSVSEQAIMIGDREHDIIGAHGNDIPVIGVLFGYGSREELEAAGADLLVGSVSELYSQLTGGTLGG